MRAQAAAFPHENHRCTVPAAVRGHSCSKKRTRQIDVIDVPTLICSALGEVVHNVEGAEATITGQPDHAISLCSHRLELGPRIYLRQVLRGLALLGRPGLPRVGSFIAALSSASSAYIRLSLAASVPNGPRLPLVVRGHTDADLPTGVLTASVERRTAITRMQLHTIEIGREAVFYLRCVVRNLALRIRERALRCRIDPYGPNSVFLTVCHRGAARPWCSGWDKRCAPR